MAKEGRTPGLKSSKRYEPDRHWLRQFINSPDPNQTFERLLAEPNSEGSSSPRNHIQKSLAEFDASFFGEPANNQVQSSQTRTVLQASTPLLQRSPLAPSPETVKLNVVTVSVPPAVALLGNVDDQYGSQSTTKPLGQESETHFKPLTTRTKEHTTVDVETADTASGPRITAGSTQNVTHMIKTEATEKFGPTVSPVPATIAALEVVDSSRLSPNPILRSPDKEDGSINKAEFPTISTESLVPRPSDNKRTSYSQIPKRPNANQVTRASDMTAQSTSKYAIRQASPTMQKNRELVVALIAYVTELLRSKSSDLDVPTVTQAEKTTTNLASSPSKPASSRGQPDVTKDLRSKGYRGTSKKRKTQISSEDEDASDSCGQEKPVLTSRKGKETMKRRFACPYFKHNPAKYGGRRYCCGPGWPDIHRLKEHLYRQHTQPKHVCKRCWQVLTTEKDLEHHQRQVIPCPIQSTKILDGFDTSQETLLRSRNQDFTKLQEIEKWRRVYKILFPCTEDKDIPSPFYDLDPPQNTIQQISNHGQCRPYLLPEQSSRIIEIIESELKQLSLPNDVINRKLAQRCTIKILRDLAQNLELSSESPANLTAAGLIPLQSFSQADTDPGEAANDCNQTNIPTFDGTFRFDFSEEPFDAFGNSNFDASLEEWIEGLYDDNNVGKLNSDSGYGSHDPIETKEGH